MATHIFDIDGTLVHYHTGHWLEGAKENILNLFTSGHKIVLITMRGVHDNGTLWSIENTKNTILKDLDELNIKYIILFGMDSPRIIHDDSPIYLDKRETNQLWK